MQCGQLVRAWLQRPATTPAAALPLVHSTAPHTDLPPHPHPPRTAAYQHDRKIRLYDVAAGFKLVKDVHARNLQWTVTGAQCAYTCARDRGRNGWGGLVADRMRRGCARAMGASAAAAVHRTSVPRVPVDVPVFCSPLLPARPINSRPADIALSADARFLLYASIAPEVHLVNVAPGGMGGGSEGVESVANVTDIHEALDFAGAVRWVRGCRVGWGGGRGVGTGGGGGSVEVCACRDKGSRSKVSVYLSSTRRALRRHPPPLTCAALRCSLPVRARVRVCAGGRQQRLGLWSIQWSADSHEIVAGTSDPGLRIYDMMQVRAVRAVCAVCCVRCARCAVCDLVRCDAVRVAVRCDAGSVVAVSRGTVVPVGPGRTERCHCMPPHSHHPLPPPPPPPLQSRVVAQVRGHDDDVNAVAYAATTTATPQQQQQGGGNDAGGGSGGDAAHLIFSGSDDSFVKVGAEAFVAGGGAVVGRWWGPSGGLVACHHAIHHGDGRRTGGEWGRVGGG